MSDTLIKRRERHKIRREQTHHVKMLRVVEDVAAHVFSRLDKRKSALWTLLGTTSTKEEERNNQESTRAETTH